MVLWSKIDHIDVEAIAEVSLRREEASKQYRTDLTWRNNNLL
jgi:hypothetical protein